MGFGPREAKAALFRAEVKRQEKEEKKEEASKSEKAEEKQKAKAGDENAKQKEADSAERKTYEWMRYGQAIGSAAIFFASQFAHIGKHNIYLNVIPTFKDGRFIPHAPLLRVPYIGVGANRKVWGDIKARPFVGKYGEIRIQEKYLFPRAPSLNPASKAKIPALTWHRYDWAERLNAMVDKKMENVDERAKKIRERADRFIRDQAKNAEKYRPEEKTQSDAERERERENQLRELRRQNEERRREQEKKQQTRAR